MYAVIRLSLPIAIFLFLLYLNLTALSGLLLLWRLLKENNQCIGTVIRIKRTMLGYAKAVVAFTDKNGNEVEGFAQNVKRIKSTGFFSLLNVGDEVKVCYAEADAAFFIIRRPLDEILLATLLLVPGYIIRIVCNQFRSCIVELKARCC